MSALYAVDAWQPYLSVVAGAGATLCGLVFVGLALNLEAIRKSPALVGRAGEAVAMLLSTLVFSLVGLIPRAAPRLTGTLLLILGLLVWALVVALQTAAYREQRERFLHYHILRVVLGQLALLPILAAGLSLLTTTGGGLAWLAIGLVMSIIVGVFDAWVLTIEIVR